MSTLPLPTVAESASRAPASPRYKLQA